MKYRHATLALSAICLSTAGNAEISLNQLSNCDSLSSALAASRNRGADCRYPRGTLERAISSVIRQLPDVDGCWLRQSPSGALSRFACLRLASPGLQRLDCIAPAALQDVTDFQERYLTDYAKQARDYVAAARTCPISNGNAARAQRTLFVGPLTNVAKFELGFALQLGTGLVGNGIALHGYASVDPELDAAQDAIEFLTIWQQ